MAQLNAVAAGGSAARGAVDVVVAMKHQPIKAVQGRKWRIG